MSALWMVVAALLFSIMGAFVKLAGSRYSVAEIVMYRSLIGVAVLFAFTSARGLSLATPLAGLHLRRGVNGSLALGLWFYATTILPLGTAMTLNHASSLYLAAAVIGVALRRHTRVDVRLAWAVAVGFGGVLLVLQPSVSEDQLVAALAGLFSGILSAVAYWNVRQLGQMGEPEWRTVFYFSLSGTLLGLAGSLATGFTVHTPHGVALLSAVGVSALLAQLAMTRAFGSVHTLLVANLQYSAIVFASIIGVAWFGDRIPPAGVFGIAIIVISGVAASTLTARRRASVGAEVTVEPAAEK